MTNVLENLSTWQAQGKNIAEQIEAERDAVAHRIEADRVYMMDLNARLKTLRRNLGMVTDDTADTPEDEGPPKGMRRAAVQAVEVMPARPAMPPPPPVPEAPTTRKAAALTVLAAGPKTTAEVAYALGIDSAKASATLVYLRNDGLVRSWLDSKTSKMTWARVGDVS